MHSVSVGWDVTKVAAALVRAYAVLDGAPVLSGPGGFTVDGRRIDDDALAAWTGLRRHVPDAWDQRVIRTWASCRAKGESVSARYQGHGWSRSTAEDRRRRALGAIAAGLNADKGRPRTP